MPSEVEAVAVELDRLRYAADRVSGLEDRASPPPEREDVRRGQAGGTGAEHDVLDMSTLVCELAVANDPRHPPCVFQVAFLSGQP